MKQRPLSYTVIHLSVLYSLTHMPGQEQAITKMCISINEINEIYTLVKSVFYFTEMQMAITIINSEGMTKYGTV